MSTPPAKTTVPQDPFGLLKAILIGLALGFIAVMLIPYVLPPHEGVKRAATPQPTSSQKGLEKLAAPSRAAPQPESGGNVSAPKKPEPAKNAEAGRAPQAAEPPNVPMPKTEPQVETPRETAQSDEVKAPPQTDESQPPVPAATSEAAKDTAKAEPVLVPAVKVSFPKTFSDEEMASALQPLLSFKVSDSDASAVKEVVSAAAKGDDEAARAAIKKISDPAAKTFADWKRLRAYNADFDEVMEFRREHPLFPEPVQDAGIEKSLFLSDAPSSEILKFFSAHNPLTGPGKASFGGALVETGERERGLSLIKLAWTRYPMDTAVQERFVSRFGKLLSESDHVRRKLMIAARAKQQDDPGKKSEAKDTGLKAAARLRAKKSKGHSLHGGQHGKKRVNRRARHRRGAVETESSQKQALLAGKAAPFAIGRLGVPVRLKKTAAKDDDAKTDKDKANPKTEPKNGKADAKDAPDAKDATDAKGKADTKAGDASKKDDKPSKQTLQAKLSENAFKLSQERSGGPATLLGRLKTLRRENADDDLWSLLRSINPELADMADPDRWWDFRRTEVRKALASDHPRTAYAIAAAHGPLDDENLSEAEFLAGWIALRFLDEPKLAEPHFQAARKIKGIVRDEARASYWLARTKLELGLRKEAEALFNEAGARFYTYYGSLSLQALRKGPACEFRAPPQPSKDAIAAFVTNDAFKAVMIAKQLDLQPLLINFVLDLARQVGDPEQMTLLSEMVERVAPPHVAVRTAKIALLRGFAVEAYAFPTLLPKFDPAGGNVKIEAALLNALTRQESEFHTGSVSHVGARGLMQLMPQTAKLVASANKVKYDLPRLISDPSYNVTLGSAFLAQLISGYDGSYILSLAAYNAGPGRVTQWIKDFGDPRDKNTDPIDWVERIPFTETRHYVQRILESTQLYRCRFENSKAKFQIVEDLHRGRPGKIPNLAEVTGSAELDQTP